MPHVDLGEHELPLKMTVATPKTLSTNQEDQLALMLHKGYTESSTEQWS